MHEASTSSERESLDIEDVVGQYSQHLTLFKFEKALEYVEELRKRNLNEYWQPIFLILSQFTTAESQYFALSFFSFKFSFRKENQLKDLYLQINSELRNFLDECELDPKFNNMEFILIFVRQFLAVVSTRIKLIEFYGFLPASNWRTCNEEALTKLSQISESLNNVFRNVIRFPQFNTLCTEISLLEKLFQSSNCLLEVPMIDTILQVKALQTELSAWLESANIHDDPTKRSFFSFSFSKKGKATSKFALLYWIHSFQSLLIAKINLYYYLAITNYLPTSGDFRTTLLNTQPSFIQYFHSFMRKSNAQLSALILNRLDLKEPFFDFNYHKCLKKYSPDYCKPITGIKGHFPPLVYFPQEKVFEKYHPAITSVIQELSMRAEQDDRVKYVYDPRADETCFISHVEKRIYLAVVFDRKIAEKDQLIQYFFNDILFNLRGSHLISELKCGPK